jgi:hypothetical protein
LRRDVDVDDLPVGGDQLGALGVRLVGLRDLAAHDDLDCALGPMTLISAVGHATITSGS